MGCGLAVIALIAAFALVGGCIVFAESGADDGKVVLRDARSYEPGSLEYVTASNFYVLTQADSSFIVMSDLDAANRANQARRCRIQQMPRTSALAALLEQYKARISPEASGATVLFEEGCNGARYDLLGTRLDADGRNLDTFETEIDSRGNLVVDTRQRICTTRTAESLRESVECER